MQRRTVARKDTMLKVDTKKCTGCKICEKICPFGAIVVVDMVAQVQANCTLCGACVSRCPAEALTIERRRVSEEELGLFSGVFIWAECEDKAEKLIPKKVAGELLSQGRRLSEKLGQELSVVVFGDDRLSRLYTLIAYGADRVVRCRHHLLGRFNSDAFTSVLSALISKEKPSIFLFGATPHGRELAPRVAARLELGLTADCTGLNIDDKGNLIQTRPAFGGNIMASIVSPYTRPQMATVRPNVFPPAEPDASRTGKIEDFKVALSPASIRTKVVSMEQLADEGSVGIEDADIIVAAGRGCRKKENLALIQELAEALGGVTAGSRALVELDWIPHTKQVGQSGLTVGPQLYIAVGISGAIQHLVGMSSAKTVIAINKDPDAPIFKVADLGIVGDAMDIVPMLIKKLKK
jgi:electron transfer flavoprotein alpha subunit/NAD-dependent dihydropyrimidine dehydrogenase PreA subunit